MKNSVVFLQVAKYPSDSVKAKTLYLYLIGNSIYIISTLISIHHGASAEL